MRSLLFIGTISMVLLVVVSCTSELNAGGSSLTANEEYSIDEWPTLYRFGQSGWGFKDASGNIVLEPQFIVASNFSEGLAFVRLPDTDEGTGFIDVEGDLVIPLPDIVEFVGGFSEGFATIVEREWNWTSESPLIAHIPGPIIFIDRTGQNVFGQEFQTARPFSSGFARVSLYDGNMFFIDITGRNAFRREFRFAQDFKGDYANVTLLNGINARINRSGRIVSRNCW